MQTTLSLTTLATLLALASLLCSTFKDLSFRLYARGAVSAAGQKIGESNGQQRQKNGSYIAVIGFTWCAACGVVSLLSGQQFGASELIWGAAVGLSGGISNILLARSMANCGTAVCSTMYRLNLVPAAVLMILLFQEPSNLMTWLGITVAGVAVLSFSEIRMGKLDRGFAVLCLASLCRALMSVSMKAGSVYHAQAAPCLCVAGAVWLCCGVAWDRQVIPDRRTVAYGFVSGVLTIGVAGFMYVALSMGNGAVLIPLSQLSFVLTAVLAWMLFKERLSMRQGLALSCAVLAVLCLGVCT